MTNIAQMASSSRNRADDRSTHVRRYCTSICKCVNATIPTAQERCCRRLRKQLRRKRLSAGRSGQMPLLSIATGHPTNIALAFVSLGSKVLAAQGDLLHGVGILLPKVVHLGPLQ